MTEDEVRHNLDVVKDLEAQYRKDFPLYGTEHTCHFQPITNRIGTFDRCLCGEFAPKPKRRKL